MVTTISSPFFSALIQLSLDFTFHSPEAITDKTKFSPTELEYNSVCDTDKGAACVRGIDTRVAPDLTTTVPVREVVPV